MKEDHETAFVIAAETKKRQTKIMSDEDNFYSSGPFVHYHSLCQQSTVVCIL